MRKFGKGIGTRISEMLTFGYISRSIRHSEFFLVCRRGMILTSMMILLGTVCQGQAPLSQRLSSENQTTKTYKPRPFSLKDSISGQRMFGYSLIAPGFGQLYNKSYFKAALVYSGMAAGIYTAMHSKEDPQRQKVGLALAGASYLYSLVDGQYAFRYKEDVHSPTKATIYAALVPGLGQIYNQKFWKLPILYGGATALAYFYQRNDFRYNYFRDGYNNSIGLQELESKKNQYTEEQYNAQKAILVANLGRLNGLSSETLRIYKNAYRRDRDYVVILSGLFYILSVMDANVDAHFFDYDISNNLSFKVQPMLSGPQFASRSAEFGLTMNITF